MIEFRSRSFDSLLDRGEGVDFKDLHFESCTFSNCALSLTKDINRRTTVKNVRLKNCLANGCDIGPAIFDEVVVDGLSTNDLLIVWGATFKHVTICGDVGKIKINSFAHHVDRSQETQGPFDGFRDSLYQSIDWALDISKARFKGFEFRGIPAGLIRRDPESQVVVTRERALRDGWQKELDPSNKLWPFAIKLFLSDGVSDTVLVAPLGAPKKQRDELIKGLHELRSLGVAEPD